jgi:hypothetical protein
VAAGPARNSFTGALSPPLFFFSLLPFFFSLRPLRFKIKAAMKSPTSRAFALLDFEVCRDSQRHHAPSLCHLK